MSCYDYSISQNIHISVIIAVAHTQGKQRPTRLSCSHKRVCGHTHAHTNYNKAGLTERSGLFVYCCLFFVCMNVCGSALRCLFIVLWVISSSPLSPCCWLGLSFVEKRAALSGQERRRRKKWKDGERRRKREQEGKKDKMEKDRETEM